MKKRLPYKKPQKDLLTIRMMQIASNSEFRKTSDDSEIQDNEDDIKTLSKKIEQLFEVDVLDIEHILITIKDMVSNNSILANVLMENDFNSIFYFLLEQDTDIFYSSLFDLLSEIFKNYNGDITEYVTDDLLDFLNSLIDDDPIIFTSNIVCIINLLANNNAFKDFFIQNGGYSKLLNYQIDDILRNQISNAISENQIKAIFNAISLILEVQDDSDVSNEYQHSIDEQKCILNLIFKSLQIKNNYIITEFNEKICILCCLDVFIRTSFNMNSVQDVDKLLIFDEEVTMNIKDEVMKNMRLSNENIAYLCLDIINLLTKEAIGSMVFLNIDDFEEFQKSIYNICSAFPNSTKTIKKAFKILTIIANTPDLIESISDDLISIAIKFYQSDVFSIKSKSAHFLAILIQCSSNLRTCSIIEEFPDVIDIICDFLHSKDVILERTSGALMKIIELSLNKQIELDISKIYESIDIDFLKELQFNLENDADDNSLKLIILVNIRALVSFYPELENENEY